jgi:hypothetical protein
MGVFLCPLIPPDQIPDLRMHDVSPCHPSVSAGCLDFRGKWASPRAVTGRTPPGPQPASKRSIAQASLAPPSSSWSIASGSHLPNYANPGWVFSPQRPADQSRPPAPTQVLRKAPNHVCSPAA